MLFDIPFFLPDDIKLELDFSVKDCRDQPDWKELKFTTKVLFPKYLNMYGEKLTLIDQSDRNETLDEALTLFSKSLKVLLDSIDNAYIQICVPVPSIALLTAVENVDVDEDRLQTHPEGAPKEVKLNIRLTSKLPGYERNRDNNVCRLCFKNYDDIVDVVRSKVDKMTVPVINFVENTAEILISNYFPDKLEKAKPLGKTIIGPQAYKNNKKQPVTCCKD